MKNTLRKYIIQQVVSPKEEEIEEIVSLFQEKQFKKGEYFKEPFKTGNHFAFLAEGAVRILIYKENIDNIIGYVYSLELFKIPISIKSMLIPVSIVPESMSGIKLLEDFP